MSEVLQELFNIAVVLQVIILLCGTLAISVIFTIGVVERQVRKLKEARGENANSKTGEHQSA